MKSRAPARQKGFTLVEIAIVLVIIGLLLGGVLKGQSLIESSKVKALKNEMQGTATILTAYQDRYKAVPGDDIRVLANLPSSGFTAAAFTVPEITRGGNGLIDGLSGNWANRELATGTALASGNESAMFWQHARAAGLSSGANNNFALNAVGGYLGITSGVLKPTTPGSTSAQYAVCSSGIKGSMARELEIAMDNGDFTTGSVWGVTEAGGPIITAVAAAAVADTALAATMCYGF